MIKPFNFNSRHRIKLASGLSLICLVLASCSSKHEEQQIPAEKADPNIVKVSDVLAEQIQLHTVGHSDIRTTMRVPGSIQLDEQRMARIGASVTGRIKDIEVTLGENVKSGQVLATLNSTELAQNQLSYIKAAQQISLQTKAVERARLLLEADVIGTAELQRREAELSAAQADLNAAHDQLLILGMSEAAIQKLAGSGQIRSFSNVVSRISGTVISRKVNLGQVVQPAEELFTIADLSKIWVVAEIPEQQIDLIEVGEDVLVEIPALDNRQYKSTLIYEADIVNPQTRTVTIRSNIDNANREIKPDMLVSMLIKSKPVSQLAIPLQSVVRENDMTYVYVQRTPQEYRLREVKLGIEYQDMVAVVNGVSEGEVIVADGAFHLNNERKSKELE